MTSSSCVVSQCPAAELHRGTLARAVVLALTVRAILAPVEDPARVSAGLPELDWCFGGFGHCVSPLVGIGGEVEYRPGHRANPVAMGELPGPPVDQVARRCGGRDGASHGSGPGDFNDDRVAAAGESG